MKQQIPHRKKFPRLGSLVLILGCASPQQLLAQTDFFWFGTTSNAFNLGSTWTGGTAPGAAGANEIPVTASTNTDVAVFNNSSRAADGVLTGSIALGSARNLGSFRFTGANVGSYSFNDTTTHRFNLTLGGSILMDSAVLAAQKLQRIGFTGSTGNYSLENP